ncbi:hypothetical protein [Vibrio sp.]|uniref:hypothetical protein n=1 Tax=Vibrio sp. TaxID=678 RepID=UPI003794D87D
MEKAKELPRHDNESPLLINSDWFTNPLSLEQYKKDYLGWMSECGNVQSHIRLAIHNFSSTDHCTLHAVSELSGMNHSALLNRLKKEPDDWLKVITGNKRSPIFSKSAVIAVVGKEKHLYQQTYSVHQVAVKLGYVVKGFRSAMSHTPDKFESIQPAIELPLSKKKRFFVDKVDELALKLNGKDLNGEELAVRNVRRIGARNMVKSLDKSAFYIELSEENKMFFNSFFKWCYEAGVEALPASEETINEYLKWADNNLSSGFVSQVKTAINKAHSNAGFGDVVAMAGVLLPRNKDYMTARSKHHRANKTMLNTWVKWCIEHGKQPLPANPEDFKLYLADYLKQRGRTRAIQMKSAMSVTHDMLSYPNPFKAMKVPK